MLARGVKKEVMFEEMMENELGLKYRKKGKRGNPVKDLGK